MLKNIPKLAWIFTSVSGLILSTGVCISMVKSSNLKVQLADFQIESTANLSKVVARSKDLEQAVEVFEEKDARYKDLERQVLTLKKYNQPVTMLEPALKEIRELNSKTNLAEIKQELQDTAKEAEQAIESIKQDSLEDSLNTSPKDDRQTDRKSLE